MFLLLLSFISSILYPFRLFFSRNIQIYPLRSPALLTHIFLWLTFHPAGITLRNSLTDKIDASRQKKKGSSVMKTSDLVYCSIFTVLIAVGAFIKIPIPVVPFTLQVLFTTMSGLLLGAKLGAVSVGMYIFSGLIGLPVFTEGGGIWYLFKPSFGYIIGFLIGSYVTGKIAEKLKQPTIPKSCRFFSIVLFLSSRATSAFAFSPLSWRKGCARFFKSRYLNERK